MLHSTPSAVLTGLASPWPHTPLDPASPVRVGLLLNPSARSLRSWDTLRSLQQAAQDAPTAVTRSVDEVPTAVARLLDQGVNVLAIGGGDGALHHALQSLVLAETRWSGALLVLPAGTLNVVARSLGPARPAAEALAAFARRWHGQPLGALPTRLTPLLRVEGEGLPPRRGFIFGSEMVKNALELYDRFGAGYDGLGRFLFEVGRGYMFHTPLWREESWRLTPPAFALRCEAHDHEHAVDAYSAVVASTVDLTLGSGVVHALRRAPGSRGFFARIIRETRLGPLLGMIPSLMRARPLDAVLDAPEARALHLHGAYTLDGECFGLSSRKPRDAAPLRVVADGHLALLSA